MEKTIIFTDGSSRGNPGPGGWAAILVYEDSKFKVVSDKFQVTEIGGREEKTTNNRMEMRAVIEALYFLTTLNLQLKTVTVFCDSSYVINGATKWVKGWQANGWKTKTKGEVLNQDLWQKLATLLSKFNIEWKQIEGHVGIPGNERCDVIATSFADGEKISLYEGSKEKYEIDLNSITPGVAQTKLRKNTGKAYSYISKVDGVIKTHKAWKECEERVKGRSGVRFKKSLSKEDEGKIIEEYKK